MEKIKLAAQTKAKSNSTMTVIRVSKETKKRIHVELSKVNKKDFGKTVRADALLLRALSRITQSDIHEIQESSLSNADRLERRYKEYLHSHPNTSKDEFVGVLLSHHADADPLIKVSPEVQRDGQN